MTTTTLAPTLDGIGIYGGPTPNVWPPTTWVPQPVSPAVGTLIRGFVGTIPEASTYLLSFDTSALALPSGFTVSLVLTPVSVIALLGGDIAIDAQPWGAAVGAEEAPIVRSAPHLATYPVSSVVAETPITFVLPSSVINRNGKTELAVTIQNGSTPTSLNRDQVIVYTLATPGKAPYLSFVADYGMTIRSAMDQLVILQAGLSITDPEALSVKKAWKYMAPQDVMLPETPCWMNSWRMIDELRTSNLRRQNYTVHMQLFVENADDERAADIATSFHVALIAALDLKINLGGTVVLHNIRGGDPTLVKFERASKTGTGAPLGLDLYLDLLMEDVGNFGV